MPRILSSRLFCAVALAAITTACAKPGGTGSRDAMSAASGLADRRASAAPAPAVAGAPQQLSATSAPGEPSPTGEAPSFSAAATDSAAGPATGAAPAAPAAAVSAMLIRTGTASIQVDSVEQAVARLRELAARLGGYVADASLAGGTDQVRSATLELKVPSDRFDALTAGLRPLGHVETVDVKAEDVGEEYVDVAAQLENGRRLETRLVALADRQSNRLADLLSVERELARVRGEIDRAEGRLRYLRAHSATSTLAVTVHARAPLIGDSPAANPIADAFREAWRVFVGVVAFLIASLGLLVPLAVLGAAGLLAWRRWGRRATRRAPRGDGAAGVVGAHDPTSRPAPPRNL